MRREGRQHGMVRTFEIYSSPWNPTPYSTRIINKFNSPATAGNFMKVSSKPTNHSKSTGKCRKTKCLGCHTHPVTKSKEKAKGTQKQRGYELSYAGLSATAILGQLDSRDDPYWDDRQEEDEKEQEVECVNDVYNPNDHFKSDDLDECFPVLTHGEIQELDRHPREEEEHQDHLGSCDHQEEEEEEEEEDDDDDDDRMSFCEVGFVVEFEDEGWYVVAEM